MPGTLPCALNEATAAFIAVLDKYTLEDLLDKRHQMRALFDHRAGRNWPKHVPE